MEVDEDFETNDFQYYQQIIHQYAFIFYCLFFEILSFYFTTNFSVSVKYLVLDFFGHFFTITLNKSETEIFDTAFLFD